MASSPFLPMRFFKLFWHHFCLLKVKAGKRSNHQITINMKGKLLMTFLKSQGGAYK